MATAAGILGFRLRPEERQPEESRAALGGAAIGSPASARPSEPAADVDDVVFWQPYSFTWKDDESREQVAVAAGEAEALAAQDAEALRVLAASPPPAAPPLTPRARLVPLLDRALTAEIDGREIDVAALVRRWTRGEWVARLPRRPLRKWPSLLVIVDRGDNLATIASDMHMLLQLLVDRLGPTRLTLWELRQGEGPEELFPREAALVADGVLALTDLGWYSGPSRRRAWLRLGRQLRRAGQRIHALVPVPAARWSEALTRVWSPIAWERPSGADPSPVEREARASRLLDLAAQARRLEPGLLRALRMLLPREAADVGTEVDAWLHGDLASRCPGATVVRAERAEVRWARFAAEESAVKAEVAEAIRGWHARRRPELWSMEALALAERGVAVAEAELRRAERVLVSIQRRALGVAEVGDPRERAEIGHWLDYVARHAPALFYRTTAAGRALQPAWGATHDPDEAPPHADPGLLALGRGAPRVASDVFEVCQVGDDLGVWPRAQARGLRVPPGGSVGVQRAGDLRIYPTVARGVPPRPVQITSPARIPARPTPGAVIELSSDRSSLILRALTRPPWATAIGRDHRGLWAEFEVAGVAVRLRWIPPGHFTM
ncbi:MAG TPA: hypothetical protein PKW35_02145, partial [Nannocystaceae bacterium]|nr:hypothetical protein [Nannocystaceae bacterium]